MSAFRKGDSVANIERDVCYRVQTAHRDGSVTVKALFHLNPDGTDKSGYLGYVYRNIKIANLVSFVRPAQ